MHLQGWGLGLLDVSATRLGHSGVFGAGPGRRAWDLGSLHDQEQSALFLAR